MRKAEESGKDLEPSKEAPENTSSIPPTSSASSQQEFLQEATKVLKSMRLARITSGDEGRCLLDGGATTSMRRAVSGEEISGLPKRVVKLAVGETYFFVNDAGALLTRDNVAPILAMVDLMEVGCRVTWTVDEGCRAFHPRIGWLPIYMNDGCPELDRGLGLELIKEAEEVKRRRAQAEIHVRKLREQVEELDVWEQGRRAVESLENGTDEAYRWLARLFPEAPHWLLAAIPVKAGVDGARVPWNRRERKKWKRATSVAVHLFCGKDRRYWRTESEHQHVVTVDQAEDLLNDSTFAALEHLACSGKLAFLFGGPPCRTFTVMRHFLMNAPGGGPRPLRARHGPQRFALEGLTDWELRKVKGDAVLLFRMIWLYLLAVVSAQILGLPKPKYLMEHPSDPQTFMDDPDDSYPSVWQWPEIHLISELLGLHQVYFDQGPLGHCRRKPTTLLTNAAVPEWLSEMRGPGAPGANDEDVGEVDKGERSGFRSAKWAAWAPGLKAVVKEVMMDSLTLGTASAVLKKLDKSFVDHLRRDHLPYRRDCRACLAGYFRGHQHRRVAVPDGWTLSIDCVGPIKNGLSEFGPQVKYALVGVLVVPDIVGNLKAFFREEGDAPEVPLEEDAFVVEGGEGDDEAGEDEDEAAGEEMAKWEEIVRKEKIEGGKVLELPFVVPLPSKAAPVVLDGITEILTKIKALGLCVRRVHSDRGREFVNMAMKRYCSHRGLVRTTTSADDFKMNGRCEAMVGRLKSATRTLLAASPGLGADHWAFAMRHVVARAQSDLLRQLGIKTPTLPPFATKVYVKRRSWTSRYQEWEEKVIPATVLCPSTDVARGFLVKTGENTYLTTTVAVEHVEEVSGNFAISPEHAAEGEPPKQIPRHRLTGKQRVAAMEMEATIAEDEEMAQKFLDQGDFGIQALEDFICQLRLRDQTRPQRIKTAVVAVPAAVHTFGLFRHGGVLGLTNSLKTRPRVALFVNKVLRQVLPQEATYTSVSVNFNTPLATHSDTTNDLTSQSYVVGVGDYVGGELWTALNPGETTSDPTAWRQIAGKWTLGRIRPTYHKAVPFSPRQPHGPATWDGYRVALSAFTVARHPHMTLPQRQQLIGLGFPLPLPPGNYEQVHALHKGGDRGRGDEAGAGNSVAPVECRSEKSDETLGGCRALRPQRGPSGTAIFGRPQVSTGCGASEEFGCRCKGYEIDPSLCVCRVSSKPQRFFIGDFADSSDTEDLKSGPGSGGRLEPCDGIRALRHLGSGEDSKDLQGQGEGGSLQHLGSGEDSKDLQGQGEGGSLQHLGSGGDSEDLRGQGEGGSLQHLGSGEDSEDLRGRGEGGSLQHLGSGGDSEDLRGQDEGSMGSGDICGFRVEPSISILQPVTRMDTKEGPDSREVVGWTLVASEEPLGIGDERVCDGLRHRRLYLLVTDNEERDALSREIENGEDAGGPERLRRLTAQIKEMEAMLELIEELKGEEGYATGGWIRKVDASLQEEVPLHTKTVPLDVVKEELERWIPSMVSEYQSLTLENQAVSPFTQEQLDEWDREGKEYDLVPGKTVHSKKAFTGRLKTRAVVCGNYIADSYSKAEKFAAGADGVLVRCCLRVCARRSWDLGALDIRTAFLLAPLLYREARPTIVKVPRVFNIANICQEKFWRVDRAMYGLCTSPRSWSTYRDTTMKTMRGKFRGKIICFRQSRADESLWYIILLPAEGEGDDGGDEANTVHGLILVYVDDLLIAAIAALAKEVSRMFQEKWRCSEPEWASVAGEVKFNGFEIRALEGGLEIHQDSYVKDLLGRRADIKGIDDIPAPPASRFAAAEDASGPDPEKVKEAQAIAGELQWLCGRCRPELTYGVNLMAQAISRSPDEALERGYQLIRFLRKHPTGGLYFSKDVPAFVGSRTARTSPTLESFTDASFAPDGSRSQQAVQIYLDGALVAWTSTRQAFVTMSTAESELVGICEGVTALKSLESLVAELFFGKIEDIAMVKKVVYTDSQAALAACQTSAGSWRTRHLRIRGNMLCELLDCPGWTAYHLEGNLMLADLGTKGLSSDRFWFLMQMMGLDRPVQRESSPAMTADKVKRMIAMMMIVALFPGADASREVVYVGNPPVAHHGEVNYLFLGMIIVVSVAVWESVKWALAGLRECCCKKKTKPEPEQASSSSSSAPPSPRTALPRRRKVRPAVRDRQNNIVKAVYMTPNGTCAHSSRECQTLNISQEFVERRLCTVCCKLR